MSGVGIKGLNSTSSNNRLRFEKLSSRLQNLNVDVVHRVRESANLDASKSKLPQRGETGCFFQDELDRCKELEMASTFKRFYYAVWPLVQSLPELIYHLPIVVKAILEEVNNVPQNILPTYFQLLSVLGRDLGDDMYPYFHEIFTGITKNVDRIALYGGVPNIELTGKMFECLSYLIRFQVKSLILDADSLRRYYGPLLGSPADFVRTLSAKCFSIFLRKLPAKRLKVHLAKVLKAVALNVKRPKGIRIAQV